MTSVNSVNLVVSPEDGAVSVVEETSLNYYASSGWTLIAIIQEEDVRIVQMRVEGSYNTVDKPVSSTKTKYVLRQTKDETMKSLVKDFQEELSRRRASEQKVHDLAKELEKGDKRIKEATEALEEEFRFLKTENERYQNTNHSMEHQIHELQKKLEAEEKKASTAIEQLKKLGGMVDDSGMPKVQEKMVRETMRKNGSA